MAKEIVRARSFWIFITIGILGAASVLIPVFRGSNVLKYPEAWIGIVIAALTVAGTWMQGYENVQAQKEFEKKHSEAMREIEQAREETRKKHSEAIQEVEVARKEALLLIKWVPRLWIFLYSIVDKLVTPTIMQWLRKRFD